MRPNTTNPNALAAQIRALHDAAEADRRLAERARNTRYLPAPARRLLARMLDHAAAKCDATEARLFHRLYA